MAGTPCADISSILGTRSPGARPVHQQLCLQQPDCDHHLGHSGTGRPSSDVVPHLPDAPIREVPMAERVAGDWGDLSVPAAQLWGRVGLRPFRLGHRTRHPGRGLPRPAPPEPSCAGDCRHPR